MTAHAINGTVMLSVPFGLTNSTNVAVVAPAKASTNISVQSIAFPITKASYPVKRVPKYQKEKSDPMNPKMKRAKEP